MFHTGKNFTTDGLGEGKRTKLGGILSNLIVSDNIERNYTASVYLQAGIPVKSTELHASLVKRTEVQTSLLKGQCHEIFNFCFFSLGPFQIFSKIHGDIHSSRFRDKIKKTCHVPFSGPIYPIMSTKITILLIRHEKDISR